MGTPPITVLFLCTGNSARSILAEATLNHLGQGRFRAFSAGSHPKGRVHRNTLWQLEAAGISTEGLSSKSLDVFTGEDAPQLDIVVTVCDQAAKEVCPVFFGDFVMTHWGMADPVASHGDEIVMRWAFADTHRIVTHRIEQLIALPIETLDRETLKTKLDAIGTSSPFPNRQEEAA
jgi:protein-tyrosine-phosphatase